jgi:hypothetical protein
MAQVAVPSDSFLLHVPVNQETKFPATRGSCQLRLRPWPPDSDAHGHL